MSRFAALRSRLVLLFAIGIGLFAVSVQASAQTFPGFVLTAPAQGAVVPAQSNVQIQWTGGDPNWMVSLILYRGTPWGPVATAAGNIPNSGSFNWSFPASLSCDEQYLFQITKTNAADWTQWNWGPAFTIACTGIGDSALKFIKTVTNNTGADLAGWQYPVTVTCGGAVPSLLSLTEGGQPQALTNLPIGVTCNIIETTPLPLPPTVEGSKICPQGMTAKWLPETYTPGQDVVTGQQGLTVRVHNTLTCVAPRDGSLTVIKTITNVSGADVSGISVPVQVQCGPSGTVNYTSNFMLDAAHSWQHVVTPIALGSTCSVIEFGNLPVPTNTGKCVKPGHLVWLQPPTFTPASVVLTGAGATITVNNVLDCQREIGTSGLKVVKTVDVVAPASSPPPAQFLVNVSCNSSIHPTLAFNYAGGSIPSQIVPQIPNGTTCSVLEQPVSTAPVPDKRCRSGFAAWQQPAAYPDPANPNATVQSVVMGNSSDTLYVLNTFACVKPKLGSLTISKLITNNTHGSLPTWYPMTVSCNGQIVANPHVLAGTSIVVNGVPLNASCQVDEGWQHLPLPASPRACPPGTLPQWQQPTYSPALPFIVGPLPVHVVVRNEIDCVKPEQPVGTLTVTKKVKNNTSADLSGLLYPVTVSCDSGLDTQLTLADGQSGVANAAIGADCKIIEDTQQLPIPDAEKACPDGSAPHWTSTISPAGYVHAGDAVTVENVLDCDKPKLGRLIVNKEVHSSTPALLAALVGAHYPVTVSCAGQPPRQLSIVVGQSFPVNNLPLGSSCNVAENPALPMPRNVCPPGTAPQWQLPVYVPAMPVSISQLTTVTVKNDVECVKTEGKSTLVIKKVVNDRTNGYAPPISFPLHVTCGSAQPLPLTVSGNGTATTTVPSGVNCNVSEDPLPGPTIIPGACPGMSGWLPPPTYSPSPIANIPPSGSAQVLITNTFGCLGPGLAPKPTPNPTPKPRTTTESIDCKAPTIANKAGTMCICQDGTIPTAKGCDVARPDVKSDVVDKPLDKIPSPETKEIGQPK